MWFVGNNLEYLDQDVLNDLLDILSNVGKKLPYVKTLNSSYPSMSRIKKFLLLTIFAIGLLMNAGTLTGVANVSGLLPMTSK
jgi:hypothetical protein